MVNIVSHPLVCHKLALMRDRQTGVKEFREATREIASLLCYEATRDLPMKQINIETPLAQANCAVISGARICIVPILRAGMGMLEGALQLIPNAKVAHLGLYRNPDTMQAVAYYDKVPADIADRQAFVVDAMVATGNSMITAIDALKAKGVKKVTIIALLMSQVGVDAVLAAHPDVEIYTAAVDPELSDAGYILPGMGDASDRIYGTK